MANRFPAIPFYPNDWLGSTARATMSRDERSAYLDLLFHYWNTDCKGLDPNSGTLRQLSGWSDMPDESFEKIIQHFKKSKGRKYHNEKLKALYDKQVAYHEGQIRAGKLGAKKRWGTHGDPIDPPMATDMAKHGSSSSSSSSYSSSSSREEYTEPAAANSGGTAEEIASKYRQMNRGAISQVRAITHIERRLSKGMNAQAALARVMNPEICENQDLWDVLDPITPNGKQVPETMQERRVRVGPPVNPETGKPYDE